jgi:hypothetical protein
MLFYKRTQEKNMILGEAIALRAYMHFDLLRIYAPSLAMNPGDRLFIPYVDKYPSYLSDRQTVGYCLERIIADLVEAQKILKDVDNQSLLRVIVLLSLLPEKNVLCGTEDSILIIMP